MAIELRPQEIACLLRAEDALMAMKTDAARRLLHNWPNRSQMEAILAHYSCPHQSIERLDEHNAVACLDCKRVLDVCYLATLEKKERSA